MEWLSENWVLVLVFGGMAVMHLLGHGHGGHNYGKTAKPQTAEKKTADASANTEAASQDA